MENERHVICQSCCNDTNICNADLQCEHHKVKTFNESCQWDSECGASLECLEHTCLCSSAKYWTGVKCEAEKLPNSACSSDNECANGLSCVQGKCACQNNYYLDKNVCHQCKRECADISDNVSGVYKICPQGKNERISVYCIMSNGEKWTVIQRRYNGSVDFYRSWAEYKVGFGSFYGEYWLGNDNIHYITTNGRHKISIFLQDLDGSTHYANYTDFSISDEQSNYMLHVSSIVSGDLGNGFSSHNNKSFSTFDRDNDGNDGGNEAVKYHGAWWYLSDGFNSNLNSKYVTSSEYNCDKIVWKTCSITRTQTIMMVKRAKI